MSWPAASFALVALVLLAGWLAHERARPSARMIAVVATLAALAALGRDAFVALPEVKPITALTFVVGYALGPLPGFAVGAVGMLASNVLLGQGPYTPWQMAAWGLVGLAGAALGRLSGRRTGRLGLAVACALAALAAKEVMNVYTWTLGGVHTPAALLAVALAALPFDAVDVGSTFLFGLAFAPELARVLARMRARMVVQWEAAEVGGPLALLVVLCLAGAALLALPGGTAHAGALRARSHAARPAPRTRSYRAFALPRAGGPSPVAAAARGSLAREVAYLASAQNADGGWGAAAGQPSSELYSAWAAIGLAAAGRSPLSVRRDGHTVLDALRAHAGTLEGPGDLERTMLALRACGAPAGTLAGRPLLAQLLRDRAPDGSFGHLVNLTSFGVFALRAAGRPAADPAVRAAGAWLARRADADGGFSFVGRPPGGGGASDVDDTAAALQALLDAGSRASPAGGPAVARGALAYLLRALNPDGGFPARPGGESNAQSTAWAVQALAAYGFRVEAVHRRGARSPLAYLESLVAPDGSVRYSRTGTQTPVWVTAQALTALARAPFPVG